MMVSPASAPFLRWRGAIMSPKMLFLLPALLFSITLVQGQEVFPRMVGETSAGTTVALPLAPHEGYTVVAVAFGKKAEPLLEAWYAPAYARFVAKSGLFAGDYQAELFLVPLFTGANRAAYGASMNKLRKEVDPDIARRVLFVKEGAAELIAALGLTDKDIPYFFVLDSQGRVLERVQGAYTVERLEALEAPMLN